MKWDGKEKTVKKMMKSLISKNFGPKNLTDHISESFLKISDIYLSNDMLYNSLQSKFFEI